MPTPLSPSSSQEIIPISPPIASSSKLKPKPRLKPLSAPAPSQSQNEDPSASTTLPKAKTYSPKRELKERIADHVIAWDRKLEVQNGKRKAPMSEREMERERMSKMSRSQVTARMISTLGSEVNPITHSDLYSRTDHFVSTSTGHQVSNGGGGLSGEKTYWEVRTAKMEDQQREQKTELFKGCSFYINGSTGPRVSNLQLQNLITTNGGKFTPHQSSHNTHIIASGGLSGTKTQKWINGQAGRSSFKRMKVIRVDWLLDCVEKGKRIPETEYRMIEDPSQKNLLSVFAPKPKPESKADVS